MASELVTPVEVGATQFAAAFLSSFFLLRAAESRLLSSSLLLSLLTSFTTGEREWVQNEIDAVLIFPGIFY